MRPGILGDGSPAPHQADALKHVELELSEQHGRSPRASQDLSGKELQLLHDEDVAHDRDPSDNLLRNSALNHGGIGSEEEVDGVDGEDCLDDDMMDKISSSPSIGEDGGYTLPFASAPPGNFPRLLASKKKYQAANSDDASSPLFYETPNYFPLSYQYRQHEIIGLQHRHHQQEGLFAPEGIEPPDIQSASSEIDEDSQMDMNRFRGAFEEEWQRDSFESNFDSSDFHHLLLPAYDPLLDGECQQLSVEEEAMHSPSSNSSQSWLSEVGLDDYVDDDDDATEPSFAEDSRFVDSGWGGECLRETEEIDFDFVYALHTFVATVEGQANATKGDTMVLLDDSNSYWWLVRVVKDGSIGE